MCRGPITIIKITLKRSKIDKTEIVALQDCVFSHKIKKYILRYPIIYSLKTVIVTFVKN